MITKQPTIELDDNAKFMIIDGVLHSVTYHHSFDDYGATLDTFRVMNYAGEEKEVYSYDECETFTLDEGENQT